MKISEVKKAVVAVVGLIAMLLSTGLLHGNVEAIAAGIVSVATALGVYGAKNASPVNDGPDDDEPVA